MSAITSINAVSANDAYYQIIAMFRRKEITEVKGRQQGAIHELEKVAIELKNPRKCLVSFPFRNISRKYCAGEFALFMGEETNVEAYEFYSKKWRELDVDGTVSSAYGERIFSDKRDPTGVSRFDYALQQLIENKESKNAVVMMRDWTDNRPTHQKDRCCTLSISFMIRENKLNMIVHMRSSDLWFGLPYDLFWYSAVMQRMLWLFNNKVGASVELGTYTHFCNSLHVYEAQWSRVINADLPTREGSWVEPMVTNPYVFYDPSLDYEYPAWDGYTEKELPDFLSWERLYRTGHIIPEGIAKLLRDMKLHPFLETMGSYLVNTIASRYPTPQDEKDLVLAEQEAMTSKCDDRKVGCLIRGSDNSCVVACNTVHSCNGKCHDKENRICDVTHSEVMALNKAKEAGLIPVRAVVTLYPCLPCMLELRKAGVEEVIVRGFSHKGAAGKVTLLDPAFRAMYNLFPKE